MDAAQTQIEQLQAKEADLNDEVAKSRARYDQDTANLRRTIGQVQREKSSLSDKFQMLRNEIGGKLQRAGLKADLLDEYLNNSNSSRLGKNSNEEEEEEGRVDETAGNQSTENSPLPVTATTSPLNVPSSLCIDELKQQIRSLEHSNGNLKRQLDQARNVLTRERRDKREVQTMLTSAQEQIEQLHRNRNSLTLSDDMSMFGLSRSGASVNSDDVESPASGSVARYMLMRRQQSNNNNSTPSAQRRSLKGSPGSGSTSRLRTVSFSHATVLSPTNPDDKQKNIPKRLSMPLVGGVETSAEDKQGDEDGHKDNQEAEWATDSSDISDIDRNVDADEEDKDMLAIQRHQLKEFSNVEICI